ncbi:universal stress protein [Streptomyces acidiscabies]|uniref:Universal stress protein n=1 Tax=Streptomyces acidiscabies TaxID=42234 RepID=A0AAP6BBR4_9ACTN|nr:universal stress protein [Streptomyces acidiscabies]MBP5942398.1 universal stress protein [Streptomyces sp. LBUM 1476]MBZ3917860.1 universal stress protein [Streptomyces acidiscabies]MDX2961830.1 universal stress protein [Streptomyces acidiscabies]MDX3023423.1 universal stress protein [Streptomyces acidiscabies]MDX3789371.1 universal stress protein [Streptomyces acidiscabies]
MQRHVTAGTDGSAESLAAAHWAAGEALRRGVGLRIVHVWPRPLTPGRSGAVHEQAEHILDRVASGVRAGHPRLAVVERLVRDAAVDTLVAEAGRAELLVLGSRGLGGLHGFVVGSVSHRVLARSTAPVVLVRAGVTYAAEHLPAAHGISPEEIPGLPYRDIVLGLDTSHPCDEPVEFAFASALRRESGLRVVHTYRVPDGENAHGTAPGRLRAREEQALATALRPWREKFPTVTVTGTVTEGSAAAELTHASARAALLVVGRRTRDGRAGPYLGAVTHAVLHHVGCPVAVVPHA